MSVLAERGAPPPQPDRTIYIIQGEQGISSEPNVVLSTILGSCIAVCLRDPEARIGGMNHFLLPDGDGSDSDPRKYGAYAMESLINGLLKAGASRHRLKAKMFGGARILGGMADIGARNAEFAARFLANEGIDCLSQSTGGCQARKIRFWPHSGSAKQLLLAPTETVVEDRRPTRVPEKHGDLELF